MRREHATILHDILLALESAGEGLSRTRLASRANVAFDRLCVALDELAQAELVEVATHPRLTARGEAYLDAYHAWVRTKQKYGMAQVAKPDLRTLESRVVRDAPAIEMSQG